MVFAGIEATSTVWLFVGAALALLTAPALALLHGDVAPRRNVAVALVRALSAVAIVGTQWILFGYSLAFGPTRHGLIGGFAYAGLAGIAGGAVHGSSLAIVTFRLMFALAMPALIAGAFADRMKYRAYVVFVLCWSTFVFDPVAHWMWAHGGWLGKLGVLDFAGGTVVHLTAGISALVCLAVLGKRPDERSAQGPLPTRDVLTKLAGAALLWLACLGFNSFGPLPSTKIVSLTFVTTQLGGLAGGLGWLVVEWRDRGRVSPLGVALAMVAGLVAITPAAGYVSPSAAVAIGFIAGAVSYGTALGAVAGLLAALLAITADAGYVDPATALGIALLAGAICYGAVLLRERFNLERAPDAFGTHAVAALAGALLTGVFAQKALNGTGADGALFGNSHQAALQFLACAATGLYTGLLTYVILKVIDAAIGLRPGLARGVAEEASERCDVTGVRERPGAARATRGAASL